MGEKITDPGATMILNFRQLEVFRAVMVAKTISGAAELLHVSQPGVSRTLKHMETKLGVDLFERRQNGLIPTPEAEELFGEVRPLYKRLDNLDHCISRIVRAEQSYVQVGCSPSLAHYLLPELLARVKTKLPEIVVSVDTMSNEDLADYIIRRHGDFALSTYDPGHPLVLADQSISGDIQCVVRKDHEIATKPTVSFEEIALHDVVGYYEDTFIGQVIDNRFSELGLTPKTSVRVRFNDDACAMVEHGLGVGFAYEFAVMESLAPSLKTIPLEDELQPMSIFLLRHREHSLTNFVNGIYEFMKAELVGMKGSGFDN